MCYTKTTLNQSEVNKVQSLQQELFALQDIKYREFNSKLIPTVDPNLIIGVRSPDLKKLAKAFSKADEVLRKMHYLMKMKVKT